MGVAEILLFLKKYWKWIALAIIVAALLWLGAWFRGVLADRAAQKVTIEQQKKDIEQQRKTIEGYKNAITLKDTEMKKYIKLQATIQQSHDALSVKYATLSKRYAGAISSLKLIDIPIAKPGTDANGKTVNTMKSIAETIVIIPSGPATYDNLLSTFPAANGGPK